MASVATTIAVIFEAFDRATPTIEGIERRLGSMTAVADAATRAFGGVAGNIQTATQPLADLTAGVLTSTTAAPAQAQRLSASLAKASVENEFVTVASLAAKTDWVFSFPTRRYNVAMQYGTTDVIRYTDYGNHAVGLQTLNFFDATNTSAGAGAAASRDSAGTGA